LGPGESVDLQRKYPDLVIEIRESHMNKTFLVLLVISQLIFTSGLASDSPKQDTDQDIKETHSVTCSGTGKSWDDCYQEADNLCPAGYIIIKRSAGVVSTPEYGKSTLAPSKKLVIACKQDA
jgi:hypothetical protein